MVLLSRLLRILSALATALLLGGAGIRPSADEVRAVQYALSLVRRYHPGPVDGLPGPLTQGAVGTYAFPRPLEADFWTVAAHLATLAWWRAEWSPVIEGAVQTALATATGRTVPPFIRERRAWITSDGTAACVRIRARDGDLWVHFTLEHAQVAPRGGGKPRWVLRARGPSAVSKDASRLWCALGYVPGPPSAPFAK